MSLLLLLIPSLALAFMLHGLGKALMAALVSVKPMTQVKSVSFNLANYFDPWGFIMILFIGLGWSRLAPADESRYRNRKIGEFLVALAGPLSYLLLATLAVGGIYNIIRFNLGALQPLITVFMVLAQVCVGLAVFTLLPIPPLDGSKMILCWFDRQHYAAHRAQVEVYGQFILIGIILLQNMGNIIIIPFEPVVRGVLDILFRLYE
jgi:Zn-dependent protease